MPGRSSSVSSGTESAATPACLRIVQRRPAAARNQSQQRCGEPYGARIEAGDHIEYGPGDAEVAAVHVEPAAAAAEGSRDRHSAAWRLTDSVTGAERIHTCGSSPLEPRDPQAAHAR